ncbi:hypothetical protein [Galactobacter valiniphilus]|uniref:hypothetical protein n=1 Tax=Galactobacter valiniphilus TaxID=2676122 RepID=UPI0037364D84
MGTSNAATLRALAAAREAAAQTELLTDIRDIAAEGRDASVLVARELMPPTTETPTPTPEPEAVADA